MNYRADIDGLRALAVLGVISCHMGGIHWNEWNLIQGGFLGVDVFFVISGFLITSILLKKHHTGTFTLRDFYGRRIRRILPALGLLLLLTIPFSFFFLDAQQLVEYGKSLINVTGFVSNIAFWKETGYFAPRAELKPLLHTWSLGVEEQFYLFFPLLILLLYKINKRRLSTGLWLATILSFSLAVYTSSRYPDFAFFLLPSRIWELGIGSLSSIYYTKVNEMTPRYLRTFGPLLGFLMILLSFGLVGPQAHHPSFITTLPVFGTALILLFGGQKDLGTKVLSTKFLVVIGLMSFSLYLFHHPILVFARFFHLGELKYEFLIYIFFPLLFVISFLAWHFVEKPFRNKQKISRNKIIMILTLIFSVIGGCAWIILHHDGYPNRFNFSKTLQDSFLYGVEKEDKRKCFDIEGAEANEHLWCKIGTAHKESMDFMVIGDSHSYALLPAFEKAATILGLSGIVTSESGCPPLINIIPDRGEKLSAKCEKLNERIFEYIKKYNIKHVFLVARWAYYTKGHYDTNSFIQRIKLKGKDFPKTLEDRKQILQQALAHTIKAYEKIGVNVTLISQIPPQYYSPQEVYKSLQSQPLFMQSAALKNLSTPSLKFKDFYKDTVDILSSTVQKFQNANFVTLNDILCDSNHCPLGSPETSYYMDKDHLSLIGAKKLVPKLQSLLDA